MVQRKVPNKLGNGIQGDLLKSERLLGSLKPSYCQHQATDLKKKMKKSRSIKLSEGSLRSSSPLRKTIAQPGKLPPLNVLPAATSQNKSVIKAVDGSPNYMKSTSSSKAKKESSPVSSLAGSDSKNLNRRCSTGSISSDSCNKAAGARTLTRTSNLKLVRTLTKSPTFKPARASAKKCSRVALCADMNVQRATCSSTLKDSKFPSYLMLNHGTESEGTSIIKVCSYTYCSLNGHHHTPLPPLKCFLKARRRSMKTQRSMKMEALSPRRVKPSGDGTEGGDEEPVVFADRPTSNGVDLDISPSHLMQGGAMDFFIEIYAKNKGNNAEATYGSTQMKAKGKDNSGYDNETGVELISESSSEGSPDFEVDFDENIEHCGDIISKIDDISEKLKQRDADEESRGVLIKEESSPLNLKGDKHESASRVDVDHAMFEVIDLEWEKWQFSASEPDYEAHSSMESDLDTGDSSESHRDNLCDEILINSDESNSNTAKEVSADRAEQAFEETLSYNQVSSTEDMLEVSAMEEEYTETDLIGIFTTASSRKKLHEEPTPGKEKMLDNGVPGTVNDVSEALEVPEKSSTIDLNEEVFESTKQFQLHSFNKLKQDETNEDYNIVWKPGDTEGDQIDTSGDFCPENKLPSGETGDKTEAEKVAYSELLIGFLGLSHVLPRADDDFEVEDNERFSTRDTALESLFSQSQDHLSESQHKNVHVIDNQSALEEDQEEAKLKVPTSMDPEEHNGSRMHKTRLADGSEVGKMEFKDSATAGLDVAETYPAANDKTKTSPKPRNKFSFTRSNAKEEITEEKKKFNPREPNFLPVVPEPDAENVDLRHQPMDQRKNAEEWMLDHALQQVVTKLAPARKRKVALLVEAFETVQPRTKCETHLRQTSTGFGHGQSIQACN
ncbi:hypothetical protein ES288_A05G370500v1 [Gossypium darwinii]|uniref:Calmodulin-binding domain-containing protein n=1 Tax=Gossypium darwinii TaxID=34276 RepID=A0A5D2GNK8_GOSDA|nr:hypothetical protein ES288_A05G370500v1 [Gossypium darwinii]